MAPVFDDFLGEDSAGAEPGKADPEADGGFVPMGGGEEGPVLVGRVALDSGASRLHQVRAGT